MSDNLAPAHARESAERWADLQRRLNPIGPVTPGQLTALRIEAYLAGYELGLNQAEADWAMERATGQSQLDDAHALMAETAQLLRGYEAHHRAKVDTLMGERGPDNHAGRPEWIAKQCEAIDDTLAKADRNATQAARLEAWMRGEQRYPLPSCADVGDVLLRIAAEAMPVRATIADNGDIVPDPPKSAAPPSVRPVTGALAHPGVADSIMDALASPAGALSVVNAGGFAIQTGDPRFDPAKPAVINGYLFTPAKEA